MRIASIPGPTQSVVELSDLKAHLRVDDTDQDDRIASLGLMGTAYVEKWTQRVLSPRAATLQLQRLPEGALPVAVPGGVVNSLTSLTVDGVAVEGVTVVGDSPARLVPASDWPITTSDGWPASISYNVGYAAPPEPLLNAVKLYAEWIFDGTDTRAACHDLMHLYRIRPIGSAL